MKCELSEEALKPGKPVEFPASKILFPFDTPHPFDRLPPLTAKVIEIDFGNKTSALVSTAYEGCTTLQDPIARQTCNAVAQQHLKVKIYQEGEFNCHEENLPGFLEEGKRHLTNISPDLRYFVVVANTDMAKEHGYYIAVE